MRIQITRTTVADGRIVRAGTVEDVSDRDAAILLSLGKAQLAKEAEPELEAPKRKGRKRGAE